MPGPLQGHAQPALVLRAGAGLAPRLDPGPVGDVAPELGRVLVVDRAYLIDTKPAYLAAPKAPPWTFRIVVAGPLPPAASSARPWPLFESSPRRRTGRRRTGRNRLRRFRGTLFINAQTSCSSPSLRLFQRHFFQLHIATIHRHGSRLRLVQEEHRVRDHFCAIARLPILAFPRARLQPPLDIGAPPLL